MLENLINNYREIVKQLEGYGLYGFRDHFLVHELEKLEKLAQENNKEVRFEEVNRPDINYSHNAYFWLNDTAKFITLVRYGEADEMDLRQKETAEAVAK